MSQAQTVADQRVEVPEAADEKVMLSAFLDWYRQTILWKLSGLNDEQVRRRLVPSLTTLLGIAKHLAYVEMFWFRIRFSGEPLPVPWTEADPDPDFRIEPEDTTASVIAFYQDEIRRSRDIVAGASLDDPATNPKDKDHPPSLRWIMIHMIEETARHAGHADILRELIDGATGE